MNELIHQEETPENLLDIPLAQRLRERESDSLSEQ
jgi:hypothetical protein